MMKTYKLLIPALAAALFASAAPAAKEPAAPPAAKEEIHKGAVTYVKTAGGYSYLKVKESGKEVWIATLPMRVSVGEVIEYSGGDIMTQFHSKAMDKTFDSIRFVTRVHVPGKDKPKEMPKEMPKDDVHKGLSAANVAIAPVKSSEIVKPKDGKSIAEIFAEKDKLKGGKVLLRAKVVKISKNILGKNWATLADGTGKSPDDRIIAVTLETPSVGDVVTAHGLVKTNVNLGAGYQYKVILEETKFTK
ncbi:MAG: hypothetical protein CO126_09770 [Hydrogenophilales bacterium CG_4_9_14_3_um_filter_63_34]|nr:MAG: hypothetical protein CO126_09770 [Hydrogenophilales bacterium CG_4_9_14_3_um_filter_63_34]